MEDIEKFFSVLLLAVLHKIGHHKSVIEERCLGTGTYQHIFELRFLHHRIIHIHRFEWICVTVLSLHPFNLLCLPIPYQLRRLLCQGRLLPIHEFIQKSNCRIDQHCRITASLLTIPQPAPNHQQAQVPYQVPKWGTIHEQLQHCIDKGHISLID